MADNTPIENLLLQGSANANLNLGTNFLAIQLTPSASGFIGYPSMEGIGTGGGAGEFAFWGSTNGFGWFDYTNVTNYMTLAYGGLTLINGAFTGNGSGLTAISTNNIPGLNANLETKASSISVPGWETVSGNGTPSVTIGSASIAGNLFLASPSGGSGTISGRAIVALDTTNAIATSQNYPAAFSNLVVNGLMTSSNHINYGYTINSGNETTYELNIVEKDAASIDFVVNSATAQVVDMLQFQTVGSAVLSGVTSNGFYYSQHFQGYGTSPNIVTNSGAGNSTGTVTLDANATDSSGTITLNTGSSPLANATICTLTFNKTFNTAPHVIICDASQNADILGVVNRVYVNQAGVTATTFTLNSGTSGLTASTAYVFNYFVMK